MITYQEELFTPSRDNTFKQLEQQEIQQQIESALLGLSEMQRAAFVLRHYEGQDLQSIADTLGCERGSVKTHLYRAVVILRTKLASLKENCSR